MNPLTIGSFECCYKILIQGNADEQFHKALEGFLHGSGVEEP